MTNIPKAEQPNNTLSKDYSLISSNSVLIWKKLLNLETRIYFKFQRILD